MPDCKMNLIHDVERDLVGRIPADAIAMVSDTLMMRLQDYSVGKASTEVVPYENQNGVILKRYLACLFVDGKSDKTIYQYKRTCIRLSDFIGKYYTEMGVYDIRYFLASERDRGVSARSCENLRANLSAFFQWMATEELIPKNPCRTIKPIKYSDQVRKPFSDVEIDALRSDGSNITEILNNAGGKGANIAEAIRDVEGGGGSSDRDLMRYAMLMTVRYNDSDNEPVSVVVPEGITEIGDYVFAGLHGNFDKVVLPSTVERLGENIFYDASFNNGIVVDCYAPASLNVGDNASDIWYDKEITFRWHINASDFYTYYGKTTPEDGATIEPYRIEGLYLSGGSSLIFNDRQYEISDGAHV